jgi:hypothetical protein
MALVRKFPNMACPPYFAIVRREIAFAPGESVVEAKVWLDGREYIAECVALRQRLNGKVGEFDPSRDDRLAAADFEAETPDCKSVGCGRHRDQHRHSHEFRATPDPNCATPHGSPRLG